jgi:hypothetical protein
VKRSVPWQPPPWFVTFQARLRFIWEAQQVVEGPVAAVKPSRKDRGGFAVSFAVTPHGVPSRTVCVEFSPGNPEVPRVFTDGPQESPHRYADGSLCMWYPRDPIDLQWARRDGAAALIGCIALHLIREQWWRETGEWLGPEAPHPVPQTRPQRTAA